MLCHYPTVAVNQKGGRRVFVVTSPHFDTLSNYLPWIYFSDCWPTDLKKPASNVTSAKLLFISSADRNTSHEIIF